MITQFTKMKKQLLTVICLLTVSAFAFSQAKPKATAKKTSSALSSLLTGIDLPYKMVNDSIATIPYEGENIASYQVIIQKISDLVIVYTNLSEALPGKIDDTKYKYLLQQNEHFDIVKIGMSGDDNSVFVRADLYKAGTTTALLQRVIKQVANVTNILAGELQ
jgi:hypothetical protein